MAGGIGTGCFTAVGHWGVLEQQPPAAREVVALVAIELGPVACPVGQALIAQPVPQPPPTGHPLPQSNLRAGSSRQGTRPVAQR